MGEGRGELGRYGCWGGMRRERGGGESGVRVNYCMEEVLVEDRISVIESGGPCRCITLRLESTNRRSSIHFVYSGILLILWS